MLEIGQAIVKDHPLTGVGPNMVPRVYAQYRTADAVNEVNPHLHNVPMHIAAERGLPALAVWVWFLVSLVRGLIQLFKRPETKMLAAGGLAAVAGMLAAGFFVQHRHAVPSVAEYKGASANVAACPSADVRLVNLCLDQKYEHLLTDWRTETGVAVVLPPMLGWIGALLCSLAEGAGLFRRRQRA